MAPPEPVAERLRRTVAVAYDPITAIFLPKHDWVTPAGGILSGYSALMSNTADRLGGSKHG